MSKLACKRFSLDALPGYINYGYNGVSVNPFEYEDRDVIDRKKISYARAIKWSIEHDLTPLQRETFCAVVLGGKRHIDVAIERGVSRKSVSVTVMDARNKIKDRIKILECVKWD